MSSKYGVSAIIATGIICLIIGGGIGYLIFSNDDPSTYEAQIQLKESELARIQAEKSNLQNQINEITDELEKSTDSLEQLNEDYQKLMEDYSELQENDDTVQLENTIEAQEGTITQLQNSIEDLEREILDVNSQLDELVLITPPIRKGEWSELVTFSGQGDFTSDYFFVPELDDVELRISWTNYATDKDEWINRIELYEKGDTWSYGHHLVPTLEEGTWIIHSPIPTGLTYLKIDTWIYQETRWKVVVEVWIPE